MRHSLQKAQRVDDKTSLQRTRLSSFHPRQPEEMCHRRANQCHLGRHDLALVIDASPPSYTMQHAPTFIAMRTLKQHFFLHGLQIIVSNASSIAPVDSPGLRAIDRKGNDE